MNKIPEFIIKNKELVDKRLNELLDSDGNIVSNAMQYSTSIGGKRIRPCIVIEFCKACGGNFQEALDFACAVEMVHTYSLIHDDLPCMDNDDTRRGMPSCHIKYGYANALLAGDGLLTKAFEVVALSKFISAENKVKAVSELSNLSGISGMIGGQVLDLEFEKSTPSTEDIINMYKLKTGALLALSAKLGCFAADADPALINAAEEYAYNLGIAFQIVDDILDVEGDEALLGKPIGSDAEQSKNTYISNVGTKKAKQQVTYYTDKAISALSVFNGTENNLVDLANYLLNRNY